MLFHPGCKPQRPIGPITLQTLAISQNRSAVPSNEELQAAVGCGKALLGLARTPNPSELQQPGVAQLDPEQLFPKKEESQAKLPAEHPNPDSTASTSHANPSRGQDEARESAAAETLILLVWVHPAAAREAWETLKDLAEGLGIGCTSRSVEAQYIPNSQLCKFASTGYKLCHHDVYHCEAWLHDLFLILGEGWLRTADAAYISYASASPEISSTA